MSALTPTIKQQRVVAGPAATALAIALGLTMLIAGAFAFGGRSSTAPGAVHSVPEPNSALREGPGSAGITAPGTVHSVPEPNSALREGPGNAGTTQYTPLHRAIAR